MNLSIQPISGIIHIANESLYTTISGIIHIANESLYTTHQWYYTYS